MDPVFNDTTTYDIAPKSPSIPPFTDAVQADQADLLVQGVPFDVPKTLAQPEEFSGGQNGADVKIVVHPT